MFLYFTNPLFILLSSLILSILILTFFYNYKNFINNLIIQMGFTLVIQFFALFLWIDFDPFLIVTDFNRGFQFFINFSFNTLLGINFVFGLDGFSLLFILLTVFIFTLCSFASFNIKFFQASFFLTLFILEFILILVFSVLDLFIFYVCFEASLIPMFFIVGFWGSRSRKIKAAFYLFLYTMATALLTLISIFYIILQVGSTFYPDLLNYIFSENEQLFLWICLFLTFATKIPMIPFHIWLPEAHVEAPTIGSVILASILLKLGGFGFIRYLLPLFPFATNFYLPFIYTLGICSVIYASFTTIRQIDLKRIIAYSSIAHMNMVVLGIFTTNWQGLEGALYLMIGHGIISSALFFLVGIVYDRYHTRLLRYYGGLIQVMPIFGILFFIFTLGNIGFPGTSNFIGETLILVGIFEKNILIAIFTGFGIILSAVYSLWLYNRLFFGTLKLNYGFYFIDLVWNEFLIFLPLIFFMFSLGVNSNFILNISYLNIEQILLYSNIL
jgi:proton-translocating NADH-quinone oxidoreductase chain M